MFDFSKKRNIPIFGTLAAFAWGLAYPMIKLGLEQFAIAGDDAGAKTLFAGIRFTIAGLVVLIMALASKRDFKVKTKDYPLVFLFAFTNTALHYFCFYIGLSYSVGSRASILNTLGTFILVLLSCMVFREEHLNLNRVLGCIVGFGGLLLLNLGGGDSGAFTFLGDGLIIANALCSAVGGLLTKIVSKRMDALVATGLSLGLGGLMLIAGGFLMGGRISVVTALGILYLAILVAISVVGFSLYNQLMKYHPVGNVAIFNSLIPIFGVLSSCMLLGEEFKYQYIISAVLVGLGVVILNSKDLRKKAA